MSISRVALTKLLQQLAAVAESYSLSTVTMKTFSDCSNGFKIAYEAERVL